MSLGAALAPSRAAAVALGDALVVAWTTPWGTALAHVARAAPEAPQRAHVAAQGGAPCTPCLFRIEGGAAVLACAGGVATLTSWSPRAVLTARVLDERAPSSPGSSEAGRTGGDDATQRGASAPHAIACAPGRRLTQLFVGDGEGIVGMRVRADGALEPERARWLARPAKRSQLAAARVHERSLGIACFDDEPALHVLHDGRGAPERVRHELSAPVVRLAASGAGNRGGVALIEQGGRRVLAFTVGLDGRMIDRTHVLADDPSARFDDVAVLWWQDGFVAVVRDAATASARVLRFDDRQVLGSIARVPQGAAWMERAGELHFVAARASEVGSELEIRGGPLGGATTRRATVSIASPPEILASSADRAAGVVLDELFEMVSGGGYRGGLRTDRDRARIAIAELGCELAVEAHEAGFVLHVRLAAPAPRSALGRWWSGERGRLERWAARASERLSAQRADARHEHDALRLDVWVATLPDAARLSSWLRSLAADAARAAWRAD